MSTFNTSDKIIKNTVFCNQHTEEQIKNMNIDQRYHNDNRVLMPGYGYVNYGFNQNFRQNGGIINATDERPIPIRKDGQDEDYRFFKYNGNWFVKPEISE